MPSGRRPPRHRAREVQTSTMQMRPVLTRGLPPDATAPRLARSALAEMPSHLGPDRAGLRLMVCELVTNCVRHAHLAPSQRIELVIFEMTAGIRVEVKDPGGGYEAAAKALGEPPGRPGSDEPLPQGGFGLMVIAALADRYGVRQDQGTVVWFEVDEDQGRAESAAGPPR
jgi:anti-sigma regulatory factor (Ser/Thr protein kinase)